MSFWETLGSVLNAVCDAGYEVLEKEQEYGQEVSRWSDAQLKQAYHAAERNPFCGGITEGLARTSAVTSECVARGIIISQAEANAQYAHWKSRYSNMTGWKLKREYQTLQNEYQSCKSSDALWQLSNLKPRIKALREVCRERNLNT